MSRTGSTLKGAATGAIAGAAFGPTGAAIGGAGGAIYGYLTGGDSGSALPSPTQSNFEFGSDRRVGGANDLAAQDRAQYGAYANPAMQRGYGALNASQQAQQRLAPQVMGNAADRQAQLAALGGTNANAAQLQAMGMAPQGPSVAAAQLQQGQDAAMQQSLAMARSGRTIGGGAGNMQQAQFQNAQTEQATNQAAAVARLQEQQQFRQFQLGALGASQQGYGQAAQQANAINASDMGLQAQNAGLLLQQQGVNNQTTATQGQLGLGLTGQALNANEFGSQMGFNTQAAQLAASEQYQSLKAGNAVNQANIAQANRNANDAMLSAGAGAVATYAASDRDVKQGIMPAGAVDFGQPQQPAMNDAQYAAQQQQQRIAASQQAASQPYSGNQPYRNSYDGMTQHGLTPQEQQMQLQSEQAQRRAISGGYVTHDSSVAAGIAANPFDQNTALQQAWQVSDVSNKKDIKAADDEKSPWTDWGALSRALGLSHSPQSQPNPGASIRDPNNPSQMISPYASIGTASNSAAAAPPPPMRPYSVMSVMPAQTDAPSTWGGQVTPVQPSYDQAGLDAAYAQSQAAPPGFQVSDAHSKAHIQSLSQENQVLRAALAPAQNITAYPAPVPAPSMAMLNQAASDQDAGAGARIAYPPAGAPPSPEMLNQAAAAQYGPPPPPQPRTVAVASDVHSKQRINELESQLAALGAPPRATAGERSQLSPGEEAGFSQWLQQNHVRDLDHPDSHYDYRGAYAAGVGRGANTGHFPDTFKQHGHPTFSIESQYSKNANDGGTWNGEQFSPALRPQAPDTAALDAAYARQGGTPNPAQPAIDLRPATGYSYEYKDPERHGQGRFYGPMAQDLERTPAGASTVKQAPDGTKMVDTSRLSLVNTAAISDLQKQIAALGGGQTQYPQLQQPNYGRIDLQRGMQRGGTY